MALLLLASVIGGYRYKQFDKPTKFFYFFICAACLTEIIGYISSMKWKGNMPIYSIYSLLEFGVLSLYFNFSIDSFKARNIGIYIAIGGILLGILNIIFLQPLNSYNSYYLFFEAIGIITMCLFSFFRMLLREEGLVLYTYPHFWFAAVLAFFWSITFLNWGLYDYFYDHEKAKAWIVSISNISVNILTYATITGIFFLYPKMKPRYV
ncbi:hypothetical protein [Taibaiella soli]|nr:hypothetical protein [Taibaiella soli]